MRTAQYGRQEAAIAAADNSGIRQRWLYGLRLLADAEKIAPAGGLRHGVTEALIEAAARKGRKLSASEIRYRVQAARAYPTEAQIATAVADFGSWTALREANFPAIEAPDGEPLADYRTAEEVRRDSARHLADLTDRQGALFPLAMFEPATATLKELQAYATEQAEMTARFAARDAERAAYLDELVAAVDGDLDSTWQAAEDALREQDGGVES
jgi:hypothetical protein